MSDWDVLSLIHGKLIGCSNDAVATFWRVVTWARGPGAKARPGFVNRAQLRHWSGGISKKRFDAVVEELEDAGKPQHDHGLLDPAEGGWWIHDFEHYGRAVDVVATLAPMPVEPVTARLEVSAARSAAGRAGGQRSAETRLASKQTAQPPKQNLEAKPRSKTGTPEAKPRSKTGTPEAKPGSSFGSGSGSDLEIREIPKANHLPKDLSGLRAGEFCFEDEDSLKNLPVGERASLIQQDETLADLLRPHRWTEMIRLVAAFATATGRGRGCAAYERDTGVRQLVALLAVFDVDALLKAIPVAVQTDFWQEQPGRPLSHLSTTVIEDALGRLAKDEGVADLIKLAEARVRKASGSQPPPPLAPVVLARGDA